MRVADTSPSTRADESRLRVVGVRTGAASLALACALAMLWSVAFRRDARVHVGDAGVAGVAGMAGVSGESGVVAIAQVIDLNAADAATLSLLPRIGPTLAARIVDDRRANGPFASVDDVARVRGVGPRTVENMRKYVVVGADPARHAGDASDNQR